MSQLTLPASLDSLARLRENIMQGVDSVGVPSALKPKIDLVLEEVLVNVATHAYTDKTGDITVHWNLNEDKFCLVFSDNGPHFDPLAAPAPDTEANMEDRPIGGLGLFFIRQMADETHYTRSDGQNHLTICFSTASL